VNEFLDVFAFPFAIECGHLHGVAPFPAFHFAVWQKLKCVVATKSFVDSTGGDGKQIESLGQSRTRFNGYSTKIQPVEVAWASADVLSTILKFFEKLPVAFLNRMAHVLDVFARRDDTQTFTASLAVTTANSFGNLIPEQLQRLGNALVERACEAANSEDGWHGISVKDIESLTGLADLSERGSVRKPQKKPTPAVVAAAELFAAHVRGVFADCGAVTLTGDGGVDPAAVRQFVNKAKHSPASVLIALNAIKLLESKWHLYFPDANGVLVWPRKRKRWLIQLPNCALDEIRANLTDWESWFVKYRQLNKDGEKRKLPKFDAFERVSGKVKGGILTDGFSVSLYGKRCKAGLQRTEERTAEHLRERGVLQKVQDFLNPNRNSGLPLGPDVGSGAGAGAGAGGAVGGAGGAVGGAGAGGAGGGAGAGREWREKRPKEEFNFVGRMSLLSAIGKGLVGPDFFEGRPALTLDPGGKYPLAGVFVLDFTVQECFRVSSREFYKRTGRDAVQKRGEERRAEFGSHGEERKAWEMLERGAKSVLNKTPDVTKWAEEYEAVGMHQADRAKVQSRVWMKERKFLFQVLESIQEGFKSLGGTKPSVIILGADGGTGHGVRGTRGHCATAFIKFLSEFFLILTVNENKTTKMCPRCHKESVFAKRSEIRSKRCKNGCGSLDKGGTWHDFCYDRDYGAVSFCFI